jgi:hypothetical protein
MEYFINESLKVLVIFCGLITGTAILSINVQYWNKYVSEERCEFIETNVYQISNPKSGFGLFALYQYNDIVILHMAASSHDETYLFELANTTHAVGTFHKCYYDKHYNYLLFSNYDFTNSQAGLIAILVMWGFVIGPFLAMALYYLKPRQIIV